MTKFNFTKESMFKALMAQDFSEFEVTARDGSVVTVDKDTFDEFFTNEIERNKRKSKKSDKPTAKQIENEGIKTRIVEYMTEVAEPITVTQIVKAFDNEYSIPKISALVKQLKDSGTVKRFEEKRVAYFEIAE